MKKNYCFVVGNYIEGDTSVKLELLFELLIESKKVDCFFVVTANDFSNLAISVLENLKEKHPSLQMKTYINFLKKCNQNIALPNSKHQPMDIDEMVCNARILQNSKYVISKVKKEKSYLSDILKVANVMKKFIIEI